MYRYLAFVWNPNDPQSVRALHSFKASPASVPAEWSIAYATPGAFVVHTGIRQGSAEAHSLGQGSGVVLGKIFDRRHDGYTAPHRVSFDEPERRTIVSSGGRHLVERYWGSYVAFIYDRSTDTHHVFREPIGSFPCYRTRYKGIDIFFSDIADCARFLPLSFPINRHYLARWLLHSSVATRDSGLENVEDVLAGERLSLSQGRIARSSLWDPITLAQTPRFEAPDEAATALRSTVQSTVDAWASCYQRITHRLSGGLDSSIVAACLARAPSNPQVTCFNLAFAAGFDQERLHLPGVDRRTAAKFRAIAGGGDERHFARLAAQRWKMPLIEREKVLSVDLRRLWRAPLRVSPALYYTAIQMDDAQLEIASAHGTQAFFSGQAGDSVFLATQQPFPAVDYACLHGLQSGLWPQVVDTAKLSRESLWTVLGKVVRHGILRRPYAFPINVLNRPTLLTEELARTLTSEEFEAPLAKAMSRSSLPPGKRDHVSGLAWSAYYEFVFDSGEQADHVDPLNSQPVWELMLQIPTYTLLAGGISRGLARRAFADLLPPEIRKRQVKGSGGVFYQQLVRRNRDFLRTTLLEGLLVGEGYLDRRKVDECLAAEDPSMTILAPYLLNYLAAEIWLQHWAAIRGQDVAQQRATLRDATPQPQLG